MTVRNRAARAATSALIAGALLVGTAGCSFLTPIATLNKYDPSDGISTSVGELKVRNVLAVSSEDNSAVSLVIRSSTRARLAEASIFSTNLSTANA
ncbi:hypothetical protein [Salinibacterium sp. PAMC 21357]|uniref:hypothetical protein n=1 Tax=Salinibacterium sp. PAMC 21357 TaxID=1112215 RepID=UPI00028856A4|nr:hypothetical protein [Salinibacterium sp. PAMC 21357]